MSSPMNVQVRHVGFFNSIEEARQAAIACARMDEIEAWFDDPDAPNLDCLMRGADVEFRMEGSPDE